MVTSEDREREILLDRDREREERIAANIHGAMRDVRDNNSDDITAQLVRMVSDLQNRVLGDMDEVRKVTRSVSEGLARVELNVATFISAFPNGDADAHRRVHEQCIKVAEDRHKIWQAITIAVASSSAFLVVVWLGYVIWKAFLIGPKG